jgi:hypothetical protein
MNEPDALKKSFRAGGENPRNIMAPKEKWSA